MFLFYDIIKIRSTFTTKKRELDQLLHTLNMNNTDNIIQITVYKSMNKPVNKSGGEFEG